MPDTSKEQVAEMILRACADGALVDLGEDGRQIVVCRRRRGEIIEDPECANDFEALQPGIFRRYRTSTTGGQSGWTWMHVCPASSDDIEVFLEHLIGCEPTQDALNRTAFTLAARATLVSQRRHAPAL